MFTSLRKNHNERLSQLRVELEYLRDYDRIRTGMRGIVDMPERKANLFILFTQNNGGTFPKRRREMFSELTDEEIRRLESIVGRTVAPR